MIRPKLVYGTTGKCVCFLVSMLLGVISVWFIIGSARLLAVDSLRDPSPHSNPSPWPWERKPGK